MLGVQRSLRSVPSSLWHAAVAAALAAALFACTPAIGSAKATSGSAASRYEPGIVLIGFRPGVSGARRRALERTVHARQLRPLLVIGSRSRAQRALARRIGTSFVLRVAPGAVQSTARALRREHRWVRYAEPDYILGPAHGGAGVHPNALPNAASAASPTPCTNGGQPPSGAVVPNDTYFDCQWGSLNTGQTITGATPCGSGTTPCPITGTWGDDDHVTQAWRISTGSRSIVIGELDSGVDYNHPDLSQNIWTNPGGIGGCAKGTRGFDVVPGASNQCDPMDDNAAPPTSYGGHGTHVAGIMGAVGDNGIGVAGVNWSTTILPVKAVDKDLYGDVSTLVDGIDKFIAAKAAGVNIRIVNYSPVQNGTASDPNLPELSDAIKALGAQGILFVTAAGGAVYPDGEDWNGKDDDTAPDYPCSFQNPSDPAYSKDLTNEICVAGSNQNGQLASWTNYGAQSVDLAAPGDNVLSTLLYQPYGYISGVSMAAPQVSGAAALILSVDPTMSMSGLKADILGHVTPMPAPSSTEVRTGGTLNICAAMPGCSSPLSTQTTASCAPASVTVGQTTTCSATVSDTDVGLQVAPTGTVTFTSNAGGTFASGGSCTLGPGSSPGEGSCSITYTPTAVGSGSHGLTASYGGDFAHGTSSGTSTLAVRAAGGGNGNGSGNGSGNGNGHPRLISIVAPTVTGVARPGRVLTCDPGTWESSPTGYAYTWERNGTAIPGAASAAYRIQVADEASRLACVVTATGAAGSSTATSTDMVVALPGTLSCPQPTGRLRHARLGAIGLGMTRAAARRRLRPFGARHRQTDDLCLYGGWGIEVSYGSRGLLGSLSGRERAHLRGRVVLATTSNPFYADRGVRPGASERMARRRLRLHRGLRVDHSVWYLIPGRKVSVVLQVRHGIVQRIGIVNRQLSRTRAAQRRILKLQS